MIGPEDRHALWRYLAVVARDLGCVCHRVGGTADHVHLALGLPRTESIAHIVEHLKVTSSKWMKARGEDRASFAWQRGYGVFSVSASHLEVLTRYIDRQMEHHHKESFEDEYRRVLGAYGVEYDERYVWD